MEAIRFSGGIWIFWRDSVLINIVHTRPQFVLMLVMNDKMSPWFFFMVYGSPDCGLRRKLWEALDLTSLGTEGAWLSAGDYNSVMSADEVSLPTYWNCHRSASFNDWVFDQGLVDMGFSGSKFTWTRGRYDHTFKEAHLDRAMSNVERRNLFPAASVTHLPKINFDHYWLLIKFHGNQR